MKNITSYFLVLVFTLFSLQLVHANQPSNKSIDGKKVTKKMSDSQARSAMDSAEAFKGPDACNTDVEFKFNDMKLLGKPLKELIPESNKCFVIKFKQMQVNDGMAHQVCQKFGGDTALNPGNPQYIGDQSKYTGTTRDNVLGYYFCIPLDKKGMCESRINDPSINKTMIISWKEHPHIGSVNLRNSGDCKCRPLGTDAKENVNCPFDPADVQVTQCKDKKSKMGPAGKCVCTADETQESQGENFCKDPEPKVTSTVDDNDLNICLDEIKTANENCSEKGQAAFDKCSKEAPEVNNNIEAAQRIMGMGVDALVNKNAGTGALAECAKMSLAGNGALSLLGLLRKTCKKELTSCKDACSDVKAYSEKSIEELTNECKDKVMAKQKPWTELHAERFKTLAAVYQANGTNAEKFCNSDVEFADSQLADVMDTLDKSVAAANVCQCQLTSSSNGTSCEELTGPLTCQQNANQPGCNFNNTVGCAPGSTAAGCKSGVVAVNGGGSGVSGFAGFNGQGFSSAAPGAATGKITNGDMDINIPDETRPFASGTTAAAVDAGSPFGSAAGAGGGQASGGGGGGDSSSKAGGKDGEGAEKGGLSGLFQSAKSGLASMFGGGSGGSGSSGKKDNKNYKGDVNNFRPKPSAVRGMANVGELNGGKYTDIWKRMNKQYDDQHHTFITVEQPKK